MNYEQDFIKRKITFMIYLFVPRSLLLKKLTFYRGDITISSSVSRESIFTLSNKLSFSKELFSETGLKHLTTIYNRSANHKKKKLFLRITDARKCVNKMLIQIKRPQHRFICDYIYQLSYRTLYILYSVLYRIIHRIDA